MLSSCQLEGLDTVYPNSRCHGGKEAWSPVASRIQHGSSVERDGEGEVSALWVLRGDDLKYSKSTGQEAGRLSRTKHGQASWSRPTLDPQAGLSQQEVERPSIFG